MGDPTAFSTTNFIVPAMTRTISQLMLPTVTWHCNRGIILLSSGHMIRHITCCHDVIKLRGRIVFFRPGFSAVDTDDTASVIGTYHSHRIIWINPEIVVIAMRNSDFYVKSFAPVSRFEKIHIQTIDRFFIQRIGINAGIIESPLTQFPFFIYFFPSPSAIVRSENSAFICFDNCPDSIGISRGDRDTDFSDRTFRHSRI